VVMNSFGNRNFMQPMGRLGWGEGRGGFFSFFLCSQHVPFKFSMGSHQVSNMPPRFSMRFPSVFPIASCFNPICFARSPPLLTYIQVGQRVRHSMFLQNLLFWGASTLFLCFFGWAHFSNWLIAKEKGLDL